MSRHQRPDTPERQTVRLSTSLDASRFEVRQTSGAGGSNLVELEGYASVFDHEYEMYGGPPYGWIERIRPGAFTETLADKPDVVFVVNHEGLPLARTRSQTLTLAEDDHGLLMRARLDGDDPDVAALVPKMKRNDVTEMSFAFRVTEQLWRQHPDYEEDSEYPPGRDITKVNINRGDVSVVTFGASDATEIDFRAALASFGQVAAEDPERALVEMRSAGIDPTVLRSVIDAAASGADEEQVRRDAGPEDGMSLALALSQLDD